MVNFNGEIVSNSSAVLKTNNRAIAYGDAVFETIRVDATRILFWEDHYFRLMSSMRIMRMKIPMNFTLEFLEQEIKNTIASHGLSPRASVRVKLTVYRDAEGLYTPKENKQIGYFITVKPIETPFYTLNRIEKDSEEGTYELELFKDYYIAPNLLSTIKTTNKAINVLAGIFAKENNYDNVLLLNTDKKVIEAFNGNLFLVKGTTIKTPPIKDGCVDGIFRKQLIKLLKNNTTYTIEESSISSFELQKADELFLTNVIKGITSVSKYRKKQFTNTVTLHLHKLLNAQIRLKIDK